LPVHRLITLSPSPNWSFSVTCRSGNAVRSSAACRLIPSVPVVGGTPGPWFTTSAASSSSAAPKWPRLKTSTYSRRDRSLLACRSPVPWPPRRAVLCRTVLCRGPDRPGAQPVHQQVEQPSRLLAPVRRARHRHDARQGGYHVLGLDVTAEL